MNPENTSNARNRNYISRLFLYLFFVVSFFEIIAEYNEEKLLIWIIKPIIIPLLFAYYFSITKNINYYFLTALVCSWIANILFIKDDFNWIICASVFFLIYRIIIIYIVMSKVKMPSFFPLIIGSVPFIFIYLMVTILTFDVMEDGVYLFILHGISTIFLGGLSLGNYIMISNRSNLVLFVSTMLFALTQFLFVLMVYYQNENVFHAIAMGMFAIGQFLLTKFIFLTEENKENSEIIYNVSQIS